MKSILGRCSLWLLCTSCAAASAGEEAPGTARFTPPVNDVLITGAASPVRIRLSARIDGALCQDLYVAAHRKYVRVLFAYLDNDGDGLLNEIEAKKTPPPHMFLPDPAGGGQAADVNIAFNFSVLDDNDDTQVDLRELEEFFRYFGDGQIRIRQQQRPSNRMTPEGPLFRRLDANQDQQLSAEEVRAAAALFDLDKDRNDLLSRAELQQSDPSSSEESVAGGGRGFNSLRFSLAAPTAKPADVDLTVEFETRSENPASMNLTGQHSTNDSPVSLARTGIAETLIMNVSGVRLELRVVSEALRALKRVQATLLREFDAADVDQSGTIQRDDRLGSFLTRTFPLLDRDDDRGVSKEELDRYVYGVLPAKSAARTLEMTLVVSEQGVDLFDMLDTNRDGQIGIRELRSSPELLAELDADGSGTLSMQEIPNSYQLKLQRGALSAPYEEANRPAAGPPWFYSMDQNRDGDLSAREFLGPAAVFRSLDKNEDGVVSLVEALRVDAQYRNEP